MAARFINLLGALLALHPSLLQSMPLQVLQVPQASQVPQALEVSPTPTSVMPKVQHHRFFGVPQYSPIPPSTATPGFEHDDPLLVPEFSPIPPHSIMPAPLQPRANGNENEDEDGEAPTPIVAGQDLDEAAILTRGHRGEHLPGPHGPGRGHHRPSPTTVDPGDKYVPTGAVPPAQKHNGHPPGPPFPPPSRLTPSTTSWLPQITLQARAVDMADGQHGDDNEPVQPSGGNQKVQPSEENQKVQLSADIQEEVINEAARHLPAAVMNALRSRHPDLFPATATSTAAPVNAASVNTASVNKASVNAVSVKTASINPLNIPGPVIPATTALPSPMCRSDVRRPGVLLCLEQDA